MIVEAACESPEDARRAQRAGADRIELCAALSLGGLTPSLGLLVETKASTSLPVIAMVRPRRGGFVYSAEEQKVMERDALALLAHGADGIAFGALTATGRVDRPLVRHLVTLARKAGGASVFHRAFDLAADPDAALLALIGLGVTRVLTSGQEVMAHDGAPVLRQLIAQSAGRIEIMAGGGVRADTVAALCESAGCAQVHLGPRLTVPPPPADPARPDFGGYDTLDEEAVRAAVAACNPPRPRRS
jgi:copper homeostasis protein